MCLSAENKTDVLIQPWFWRYSATGKKRQHRAGLCPSLHGSLGLVIPRGAAAFSTAAQADATRFWTLNACATPMESSCTSCRLGLRIPPESQGSVQWSDSLILTERLCGLISWFLVMRGLADSYWEIMRDPFCNNVLRSHTTSAPKWWIFPVRMIDFTPKTGDFLHPTSTLGGENGSARISH